MAQLATAGPMTPDEFLTHAFPPDAGKVELIRGEAVVNPPASGEHGATGANVLRLLASYVHANRLGQVFGDSTGFELPALPQTVRCPDVSFVRSDRLPSGGVGRGFLKVAPDLAVEVLSPSENPATLDEMLADYRAAGTPLIWVLNPERRTVMILSVDAPVRWLGEHETLDGGAVVPGFSCRVGELFDGVARG